MIKLYGRQPVTPDDAVWRTLDSDTRLTYFGLRSLLQKLGKKAGVKPCNPHRFRRTFALLALRNGMNVYALQRIMGHSDLTVLRRYLALVDDDLLEAHQQFGAVDLACSDRDPAGVRLAIVMHDDQHGTGERPGEDVAIYARGGLSRNHTQRLS